MILFMTYIFCFSRLFLARAYFRHFQSNIQRADLYIFLVQASPNFAYKIFMLPPFAVFFWHRFFFVSAEIEYLFTVLIVRAPRYPYRQFQIAREVRFPL